MSTKNMRSINALKTCAAGTKGYDIKTIAATAKRSLINQITAKDEIVLQRDDRLHVILRGNDITGRLWLAMEGPRGSAEGAEDSAKGLAQNMLAFVIEWLALNTDVIRFTLI